MMREVQVESGADSKPVVLERAIQIRNSFVEDESGGDKLVFVLQGAP